MYANVAEFTVLILAVTKLYTQLTTIKQIEMIEQQRLNNIHNLQVSEIIQIMNECFEATGLITVKSASVILDKSTVAVYDDLKAGRLSGVKIDGVQFVIINKYEKS